MDSINKDKLYYLDGIRGIASLLVVIGHFRHYFFNFETNNKFFNFIWSRLNYFFLNGEFCVVIFFTLSGFVLMHNLLINPAFLSKQLFKRIFRLGVPVTLSVILYILVINLGFVCYFSKEKLSGFGFIDTVYHLLKFLIVSDERIISLNSSLWTIPIEIFWSYIIFMVFYFSGIIKSFIIKSLLLIFILLLIFNYKLIGYQYAFLFVFGSLLSIFKNEIIRILNSSLIKIIYLLLLIILIYTYERNQLIIDFYLLNFSFIISPLLIVLVMSITKIRKLFENKIILWLGRISFALYLLHILILASISNFLFNNYIFFQSNFGLILLLLISLSFSLILAHLFTVYLDEQLMKLFDEKYKKVINAYRK